MKRIILGYIYAAYGSFWLRIWCKPIVAWFFELPCDCLRYKLSRWILQQAGYCRHPYYEIDVYEWRHREQ